MRFNSGDRVPIAVVVLNLDRPHLCQGESDVVDHVLSRKPFSSLHRPHEPGRRRSLPWRRPQVADVEDIRCRGTACGDAVKARPPALVCERLGRGELVYGPRVTLDVMSRPIAQRTTAPSAQLNYLRILAWMNGITGDAESSHTMSGRKSCASPKNRRNPKTSVAVVTKMLLDTAGSW